MSTVCVLQTGTPLEIVLDCVENLLNLQSCSAEDIDDPVLYLYVDTAAGTYSLTNHDHQKPCLFIIDYALMASTDPSFILFTAKDSEASCAVGLVASLLMVLGLLAFLAISI